MGRENLPPDHGLLLHYPELNRHGIWMFNCLIPLSVAFIDQEGRIVEIHRLKAYPEMMRYTDPVRYDRDLENLNFDDPVVQFFIAESVISSKPVKYALEMPLGWFEKNRIGPGDIVLFDPILPEAKVLLRKSE